MTISRSGKKRLTVDINHVYHTDLKKIALKYETTVTEIVTKLVLQLVEHEKENPEPH